jgi:hypothetical protein
MSFQKIRGGKSFGVALEMFEYFKGGDINRGYCWSDKEEKNVSFVYVPAGTTSHHFIDVARMLSGDLCEVRAHDVEKDVPELNRNRRHVEFFIEHEPRKFEPHELTTVHFKLTLIQYGGGVWGFLAAELTETTVGGKKTITRYSMRKSVPELGKPHFVHPRRLIFPGYGTWAILGLGYPICVVSQESTGGEELKNPTLLEIAQEISDGDD